MIAMRIMAGFCPPRYETTIAAHRVIWLSMGGAYRLVRSVLRYGHTRPKWYAEYRCAEGWHIVKAGWSRRRVWQALRTRMAADAARRRYLDPKGRELFVSTGISGGKAFFTCYRRPTGSLRRYVSAELAVRPTEAGAQADLDQFARKRRLEAL
jgi:hypothetical protein